MTALLHAVIEISLLSHTFGAVVRQFQNGSYAMPTGMTVSAFMLLVDCTGLRTSLRTLH